jgi:hypothetical protein
MISRVELSPDLIRLTQHRANRFNLPYRKQVARCVAEQAVLELDPESNFLLDNDSSLSEVYALVCALRVNDIVVNGRHIDVSLLEDGEILMANALIDTPYLECGSLVVKLDGANVGAVVGYVASTDWSAIAKRAERADVVSLSFRPVASFDFQACLQHIESTVIPNVDKPVSESARAEDYLQFSRERASMPLARQRLVVASAVSSATVRKNIGHLASGSKDVTAKVLRDSSVWEVRIIALVGKIQEKCPNISLDKIEELVRLAGAQSGGQPEAPAFKRVLSKSLAKHELDARLSFAKLSPEARALMESFFEKVAAGKGKIEAIHEYIKNQAAIDVARVIAEKREHLHRFSAASADELGFAYQKLALQPAYATHSASDATGLESINEALNLFDAGEIIEELLEIDI